MHLLHVSRLLSRHSKLVAAICCVCLAVGARAKVIELAGVLSGAGETPSTSTGTGTSTLLYDTLAHTLEVEVTFSGLLGTTTASHIHAATATPFTGSAGVATQVPRFSSFPVGVTSGSMDQILDLTQSSSFNPAFVTAHGSSLSASETALIEALLSGQAYLNVHSTFAPGGEIRTFFKRVPETGTTAAWLGSGLLALLGANRRLHGRPA